MHFTLLFLLMALQSANPVADLRWKNRVIILSADDSETSREQIRLFATDAPGFAERKLVVFMMNGDTLSGPGTRKWAVKTARAVRRAYAVPERGFQLKLIGLDGGVKLERSSLLSLADLYAVIDGMPMRRAGN